MTGVNNDWGWGLQKWLKEVRHGLGLNWAPPGVHAFLPEPDSTGQDTQAVNCYCNCETLPLLF